MTSTWLAIDPSSTATGWAVMKAGPTLLHSGVIRPSRAKGSAIQYVQIARYVREVLAAWESPVVVIEVPSGGQRQSAVALMTYAESIGWIGGVALMSGAKVYRVPVNVWKSNASKLQTTYAMRALFGLPADVDDNEADAVGIAQWWSQRGGYWQEVLPNGGTISRK